jgi:hypothetical protein
MNFVQATFRNMKKFGHALSIAALCCGVACGSQSPSSTTDTTGATPSESTGTTSEASVVKASEQSTQTAGISYYAYSQDSDISAFSAAGERIASFRGTLENDKGSVTVNAGEQTLAVDFSIAENDGFTTVAGTANGTPVQIRISKDGNVLEQTRALQISPELNRVLTAAGADLHAEFSARIVRVPNMPCKQAKKFAATMIAIGLFIGGETGADLIALGQKTLEKNCPEN